MAATAQAVAVKGGVNYFRGDDPALPPKRGCGRPPKAKDASTPAPAAALALAAAVAPPAKVSTPAPVVEGVLCLEEVDGRQWSYMVDGGYGKGRGRGGAVGHMGASVRVTPLQSSLPPAEDGIMGFWGYG
ncbi:hypothetical protein E2562_014693 [Oryza meyeriana var. granulata]|uniref:Uncharacterized protein n=1 Tax=Oryza meyeriana var. granulata TaxID=110450 RepID=A0A6G1D463_9ORYZ|nr:hypothetical protein E2562_014693 [Oryza meyeriana var. granulata]